jgi:hypothetical protein
MLETTISHSVLRRLAAKRETRRVAGLGIVARAQTHLEQFPSRVNREGFPRACGSGSCVGAASGKGFSVVR